LLEWSCQQVEGQLFPAILTVHVAAQKLIDARDVGVLTDAEKARLPALDTEEVQTLGRTPL
jgi:hypothetical protein